MHTILMSLWEPPAHCPTDCVMADSHALLWPWGAGVNVAAKPSAVDAQTQALDQDQTFQTTGHGQEMASHASRQGPVWYGVPFNSPPPPFPRLPRSLEYPPPRRSAAAPCIAARAPRASAQGATVAEADALCLELQNDEGLQSALQSYVEGSDSNKMLYLLFLLLVVPLSFFFCLMWQMAKWAHQAEVEEAAAKQSQTVTSLSAPAPAARSPIRARPTLPGEPASSPQDPPAAVAWPSGSFAAGQPTSARKGRA